ncbi:serine hydrolase domain-containing protein [Aureibacter tunicatorum]|uniref:CubicO group peptidase (Beta-lactamase class C family) n=1 Tax=Aureibacter tunicatorum TaxID=866807 RepID=A0AAE4BTV8_9BACT|nr:serine hydrolase domain-containing protein [Aureibacter tunicatorum]MDR6240057.1 CubicO group peptidase (beta-lactamase class C family) [Aureibacter tunicatorum]
MNETESIIAKHANEFLIPHNIHSVSIGVFNKGEEYSMHFGEISPDGNESPTDSTLYELASISKTFVGTMTAQAVLDNKLSLDDDIRIYLEGKYPNLQYNGEKITIKHILTHTSGFPNFPKSMESKEVFWEEIKEIEINESPGTKCSYSNTAPELLAYILERVYDTPYQALVVKNILDPNGMKDTKVKLSTLEQNRLIQGYNGETEPQAHLNNRLWGGIAGYHSTTQDMIKYIKFHLNEDNPVVKESHKNFYSTSDDYDIGYHWNIIEIEGTTCYLHHGGIWGMQNWLMVFPEDNIGIVVSSNASFEGIDDRLFDLAEGVYKELR